MPKEKTLIEQYRQQRKRILDRERDLAKRGYALGETLVPRTIKKGELSDIELQAEINRISQIKPIDIYARAVYVTPENEVISGAEQQHRQHIIGYYKGIGKEQLEKRPEQVPRYVENYFRRRYSIEPDISVWKEEADRQYQQEQDDRYRIYRDYREKYPMEIADQLTKLELAKNKTERETIKNAIQNSIDRIKSDYEQRKKQEEFDAISLAKQKDNLLRKYYQALDDNDKKAADYYKESFERISGETVEEQDLTKYSWYQAPETVEEKVDEEEPFSGWHDESYDEDYEDESEWQDVDYNYYGDDYRIGDEFASDDVSAYYDIIERVTNLIADGYYVKSGGLISKKIRRVHRKGANRFYYYDTETDKNKLLTLWRNTVDKFSATDTSKKELITYIADNARTISNLIGLIQNAAYEDDYEASLSELANLLNVTPFNTEESQAFFDR